MFINVGAVPQWLEHYSIVQKYLYCCSVQYYISKRVLKLCTIIPETIRKGATVYLRNCTKLIELNTLRTGNIRIANNCFGKPILNQIIELNKFHTPTARTNSFFGCQKYVFQTNKHGQIYKVGTRRYYRRSTVLYICCKR